MYCLEDKGFKLLNRNYLKYIVIIFMALDHFVSLLPESHPLFFPIQFISRLTAPTMALFIAEGYKHTSNLKKYFERLGIFAVISYIPYVLARTGELLPVQVFTGNIIPTFSSPNGGIFMEPYFYLSLIKSTVVIQQTSVIFTLLLGLFAIYLWDKVELSKYLKAIITVFILWLAAFGNWSYYIILFCLIFYFLKDNLKVMWTAFTVVSLLYIFSIRLFLNPFHLALTWSFVPFGLGLLIVPFFLTLYNGKPGNKSKFNKWFFYIFYPGHLLILGILRIFGF